MKRQTNITYRSLFFASALVLAFGACTRPPRPAVMAEAESARQTPAVSEAAKLAPQAILHADNLRKLAEEAYEKGDYVGAQLHSERALAAYQHAHVLARLVRAEQLGEEADFELEGSRKQLAETEAELEHVLAEIESLEMRIKVAEDALPITPSSPTDNYRRELARLASARSLHLDARLLCTAARLLDAKGRAMDEGEALVAELGKALAADDPHPVPIDEASRARAKCLEALTQARRVADNSSSLGHADTLLASLSAKGGLDLVRDDRGVVVTLRELFRGSSLSREASERLRELGELANENPGFPIQIVVHSAKGGKLAIDEARGAEVKKALVTSGASAEKIHIEPAGSTKPVVDPSSSLGQKRNERVEIVFVNPGG